MSTIGLVVRRYIDLMRACSAGCCGWRLLSSIRRTVSGQWRTTDDPDFPTSQAAAATLRG